MQPTSATDSLGQYRQQATELLQSAAVQQAFQINREPDTIRERYGRHKLGQSLLLARRLVESGVRFINVNDKVNNGQDANWDSHLTIFPRHRELLAPADQALSAFLEDLEQRGLLDSTLVVAMGEFGRTPRVNANAGRDHWPDCFSVVVAGGGVKGGSVYGESDRTGAFPVSHPVTPGDLAATLFWRFGVDHKYEVRDSLAPSRLPRESRSGIFLLEVLTHSRGAQAPRAGFSTKSQLQLPALLAQDGYFGLFISRKALAPVGRSLTHEPDASALRLMDTLYLPSFLNGGCVNKLCQFRINP